MTNVSEAIFFGTTALRRSAFSFVLRARSRNSIFRVALCASLLFGSETMAQQSPQLDEKRLEYAKQVIKQYGDKIPPEIQVSILAQKVVLGMPPYESYLAAGAFSFEVKADPAKWPPNADPYVVIQAQSLRPDKSQITLTFKNATQFPEAGTTSFRVRFENGRAVDIQEVGKNRANIK